MPISSRRLERARPGRGFTLVEVLVASGVASLVLAAVLTASLQLVRSGVRVTQYAEMDAQVRRAFEQLSIDLKSARSFTYNGESDITVGIPRTDGSTAYYTYAWSNASQTFYRVPGTSSASTAQRIDLIRGIPAVTGGGAGLSFARQDDAGGSVASDGATKRIQVSLTVARSTSGARRSTSSVSATFILRNKPVS